MSVTNIDMANGRLFSEEDMKKDTHKESGLITELVHYTMGSSHHQLVHLHHLTHCNKETKKTPFSFAVLLKEETSRRLRSFSETTTCCVRDRAHQVFAL